MYNLEIVAAIVLFNFSDRFKRVLGWVGLIVIIAYCVTEGKWAQEGKELVVQEYVLGWADRYREWRGTL